MNLFNKLLLRLCLQNGHFIFASGNHANQKIEFDKISTNPFLIWLVARKLARAINQEYPQLDAIVTVATGANILGPPTAMHLSKLTERNIKLFTTSKNAQKQFKLQRSKNSIGLQNRGCVIVDDVYNHGTNSTKVGELLTGQKAQVLGTAVIFNRSSPLESEVVALIDYPMQDCAAEDCKCNINF